jgi:hypothetical protein
MDGIATVRLQGQEYECSIELAEAIDAALEQAWAGGAAEQLEPMDCGHPKAAAAYRDDDVFLCCAWCVS